MKKIILILLLVILGFAICKNRVEVKEQTEENLTEENFNNKEETSAYINQPKFNCSVYKMCEVLKKDKNLKLQNNKKLCIFEDKNEKFEIQIGAWDTEISEIYYTIHDKDPMKDDKVSVAFFETVKEILDVFSENVKEEEIRQEFSKIKIPEQSMEWNYSEKISLFVGRTGDDFDFRIYPR